MDGCEGSSSADAKIAAGAPCTMLRRVVNSVQLEVTVLVDSHDIGLQSLPRCTWNQGERGECPSEGLGWKGNLSVDASRDEADGLLRVSARTRLYSEGICGSP